MCSVELLAEDIVTINNMIKWHITANISVGLHENCLLVRSFSGKCVDSTNTNIVDFNLLEDNTPRNTNFTVCLSIG